MCDLYNIITMYNNACVIHWPCVALGPRAPATQRIDRVIGAWC